MPSRRATVLLLLGIVAAGAWLRLYSLGEPSMGADNLTFLQFAEKTENAGEIYRRWPELQGYGHLPFAPAAMRWVIDTLSLDISHFSVRLSSALFGVLSIPAAFWLGFRVRGAALGLIMAGMLALSPLHIQQSRLSYYYAPMMLGSFVYLAEVMHFAGARSRMRAFDWRFHLGVGVGFFLLTHSVPAGWTFAALSSSVLLYATVRFSILKRHPWLLVWLVLLHGIVLLPIVMQTWGWFMMEKASRPEIRAHWREMFAGIDDDLWWSLGRFVIYFGWGSTLFRGILSVLAPLAGLLAVWKLRKEERHLLFLPALALINVIAVWYGRTFSGHHFSPRYLYGAYPAYLALLAIGLWDGVGMIARRLRGGESSLEIWCPRVVVAVSMAMLLYPAWLTNRVTGVFKPAVQWADRHLPYRTPVVCDRFFTAWHEMPANNPTSVVFTATQANEPQSVYEAGFRKTTEDFLRRNPDAAMFEQKHYRDLVGPWDWTRRHFKREQVFGDPAWDRLQEMGLLVFTPHGTQELSRCSILYNTPEDLVDMARASGVSVCTSFGAGWGIMKTQDMRDWRVLSGSATVRVWNLGTEPVNCDVMIRGAAAGGERTVRMGSATASLPANTIGSHVLRGLKFPAGASEWAIEERSAGGAEGAVLVSDIATRIVR